MSTIYADLRIRNPEDPTSELTVTGLVDSGADFSVLDSQASDELGLASIGTVKALTIGGESVRGEVTFADVKLASGDWVHRYQLFASSLFDDEEPVIDRKTMKVKRVRAIIGVDLLQEIKCMLDFAHDRLLFEHEAE